MPTNLSAPSGDQVAELLGGEVILEVFETPSDFTDGAGAYWARPEQYCDPVVQRVCRCSPYSMTMWRDEAQTAFATI
jgi:hypothetical protein